MVDELAYRKREGVLYKLDMKKTYDQVNWGFMDYMLAMLDFEEKWRCWVKACISTTSFAVIVNGGSSTFFQAPRGLRQDNPLSLCFSLWSWKPLIV